jgi:hypothetical protein
MEAITDPALQAIPVSLRNLQATVFQPPLGPDYGTASFHQYGVSDVQQVNGQVQAFAQPRQNLPTPVRYSNGSFSVVTPDQRQQQPTSYHVSQNGSPTKEMGGHFGGMKTIPNPPDLQQWRDKLFNINELITLTEDE